jgi:hypothetical protein
MPIASLSRFTVPISGSQASTTQGLLMPKLKYRFRVTLDSFGVPGQPSTELTKQVMNVSRPEVSFEEIKLPVYNSTVKLLGKHNFADAKLTIRDDASGIVSRKVGEQLQKQFDFFEQSGAASGIDYKFRMRVEILDGGNGAFEPVTLESFEFLGCFIKQATYQGGDYNDATNPMDIALTITYDNAIQLDAPGGAASGIGIDVGRVVRPAGAQGLSTGG